MVLTNCERETSRTFIFFIEF